MHSDQAPVPEGVKAFSEMFGVSPPTPEEWAKSKDGFEQFKARYWTSPETHARQAAVAWNSFRQRFLLSPDHRRHERLEKAEKHLTENPDARYGVSIDTISDELSVLVTVATRDDGEIDFVVPKSIYSAERVASAIERLISKGGNHG